MNLLQFRLQCHIKKTHHSLLKSILKLTPVTVNISMCIFFTSKKMTIYLYLSTILRCWFNKRMIIIVM